MRLPRWLELYCLWKKCYSEPAPAWWFQVSESHVVPIKTRCVVDKLFSTQVISGRRYRRLDNMTDLYSEL
jgi:hypothetical protein